jgi:hypothetical protein
MKYSLNILGNRLCSPRVVELNADKILCNDIYLPKSFNPHNKRLMVIGNEFGALGAVWAESEQEALDVLVDKGLGNSLLVDKTEIEKLNKIISNETDCDTNQEAQAELDSYAHLGNAGELADLSNVWLGEVSFEPVRDLVLLLAFAQAKGANVDNLDQI